MKEFLILTLAAVCAFGQPTPEALLDAGHFKRARAIVEQLAQSSPNDARVAWLLARVRRAWRDFDSAQKMAEQAVALDPKNAQYHATLSEVLGEIAQKASMFKQLGLAPKIRKEAETALTLDPNQPEALHTLTMFYWMAPGIMGGDRAKARELVLRLTAADPARGYSVQARMARDEKQPDRVADLFQKAVETAPRSYAAWMALAGYQGAEKKRDDLAEKALRKAIEADPERAGAYTMLALHYAEKKRNADLDKLLLDAEKQVPGNPTPYFAAATRLTDDLARAERYIRKYLAQEPEPGAPSHGRAHHVLGTILEKQGKKSEAIAALETAIRMQPDFDQAKKDLKRLKS